MSGQKVEKPVKIPGVNAPKRDRREEQQRRDQANARRLWLKRQKAKRR